MVDTPLSPNELDLKLETPSAYIPMDRLMALASGTPFPERTQGAALFADISGFTAMTESLVGSLGDQRGSEEITRLLDCVFDAIIAEVQRYGGSVVSFGGDAITCWFEGDDGLRATAAGLAMQLAMQSFARMSLALKVAIAAGPARRMVIGDPKHLLLDALAGATIDTLASAERHTDSGEVVLDQTTALALGRKLVVGTWRMDATGGQKVAVVSALTVPVLPAPCPAFNEAALCEDAVRPWLLPLVYSLLRLGQGAFLAELRPVVTLFMRFTGIDYDVEENAGDLLDAFIRQVQAILADHEGTLLQVMFGDKGCHLYAAFGAPFIHEDDVHRAADAALRLSQLAETARSIQFVQIGIAKGIARTGTYGGRTRRTYGALGEAVNLSARLMQAATPGQILVSLGAYQEIASDYNWETLPPIHVKGKSGGVAVYALLNRQPPSKRRKRTAEGDVSMVGREQELALILEKFDHAIKGRGQVLGISAEPGLGKSRLAAEATNLAGNEGWLLYQGECSSSGTNTSYHAWITVWRSFFHLDPSSSVVAQTSALEATLRQIDAALALRLPLLAPVVDLPLPNNDLTSTFDAKLRRSSLEALLVDCLHARCQQGPVLIVLEDCHWLDPLSRDLLEAVAKAIVDLPGVVLFTFRSPERDYLREPRVSLLAHYTGIELASLTPEQAHELIQLRSAQTLGNDSRPLPTTLVERIVELAEGNPYFVEEFLDYLSDKVSDQQETETLAKLELPTSLQALTLSRVDQVAEHQRTTLKAASVIGRVFDSATLWGYYPRLGGESLVRLDLQRLTRARLTQQLAHDTGPSFAFRHALMHEVVYQSLPHANRAALHEQLAFYIEGRQTHEPDQLLDQLAFHYGLSHNSAKKREYLLKAGHRAQQIYANSTAIDYFQRVLPLLAEADKVTCLLDLGVVLEHVGRWREARAAYEEALDLVRELGDRQRQAQCEVALGQLLRKQGLFSEAAVWLDRAKEGFEAIRNLAGVGQVLNYQGTLTAHLGDLDSAQRLFELSLAVRQELRDKVSIAGLYSNLGILARRRSDLAKARTLFEESLAIRQELGDRWGIGVSLNNLGTLALVQGDTAVAQVHLERALAIWRQIGDRWAIANTLTGLGEVVTEEREYEAAFEYFRESLSINRELDDRLAMAYVFEALGCLAATQNHPRRALQLVGAAASLRSAIGAPLSPAEQTRLHDRLAPARHELDEAAQQAAEAEGRALTYEQAIELALRWTES